MQRHEKLQIAKWAFEDISEAIQKWEYNGEKFIKIDCGWDGEITVDDETFTAFELRDKDYD